MIAKILESFPSMERVLDYNEKKVAQGVASVIGVSGISGDSPEEIREVFERFERINNRSRKVSFHMALSPDQGEEMSDEKAFSLACEMMRELGYGDQPFAVYRHNDIDRVHYHVVSIRTDRRGKKIRDHQENARCFAALKKYAPMYGYTPGKGDRSEEVPDILQFNPKGGDVISQITILFDDCLKYRFTTYDEFLSILWAHGLRAEFRTGFSTHLYLQGLDAAGKPCTRKISEKQAATAFYQLYSERALECKDLMKVMRRERERICNCARWPLEHADTYRGFCRLMAGKQIQVKLDRNPDTHKFTGGHFVDHHNRCAFTLSELAPGLSLDMVQKADEERWSESRDTGPDITLGDFLAGLSSGRSKSRERDMTDDPKRKKKQKSKGL